jgi:hypothetical protein
MAGCCMTSITFARQVIRHFEFTPAYGSLRSHKFEALITTYELVLKDAEVSLISSPCAIPVLVSEADMLATVPQRTVRPLLLAWRSQ